MEKTLFVGNTNSNEFSIKGKHLIFITLLVSMFAEFLIDELKLPLLINYINDLMWCGLLVWMIVDSRNRPILKNQKGSLTITVLLLASTIFGVVINFESIFLILWGYRTIFRGIVFFFACSCYLTKKDFLKIMDSTVYLQIFSFVLGLYQYAVLGLRLDNIGGIFGHGNGGLLNPFQAIIIAYYLNRYLKEHKGLWKLVVTLITALILAVFAEEKAFFVYLFSCIFLTFLLNKPTLKTFLFAIGVVLLAFAFMILFGDMIGFDVNFFLDFDQAFNYAEKSYGISRINPYTTINEEFFADDWLKYLFGYGIGNCERGSFDIFTSNFYLQNESLNYYWFTHAFVLLELGYVGFILFIAFFVYLIGVAWKNRKRLSYIANVQIIAVVISLLSMMFSSSLIINGSYIIYFALAGVYIFLKGDKQERLKYAQ